MNWTGGRLSRGRGNKKGSGCLTARQKEHYAKIRASTQNAPHKWPILNNLRGDIEPKVPKDLSPDRQHARQPSHRSSYEPRGSLQSSRNQELLKIKRERQSPEHNYYDATPPPQKIRRNEGEMSPTPNSDVTQRNAGVDARRRKLLSKGDWTGVTLQKPMRMKFAPQQKDDRVGRRRKVADGHRARYGSRQFHITSPHAPRGRQNPRELVNGGSRKGLTGENVRISIGNKEIKPSTTSISSSEAQHSSVGSHFFNPRRHASSNVMLLGNDGKQRKEIPRSTKKRTGSDKWLSGTPTSASNDYESYHGWHTSLDENLSEEGGPKNLQGSDDSEEPGSGISTSPIRDCNDWEIPPEENGPRRPEQSTREDLETRSYSADSDMLRIVSNPAILLQRARDGLPLLMPLSPTYVRNSYVSSHSPANIRQKSKSPIFSSSNHLTPFHPKPERSNVRRFLTRELQSESSEIQESTAAEVGKDKPVVPSSQLGENAIWETWMFPSDEDRYTEDSYSDEREQAALVSPGVSALQEEPNTYTSYRHGSRDGVDHMQLSGTSTEAELSISMVPMVPNSSPPVQVHCRPQGKHKAHFIRQNVSPEFRVPQEARRDTRNIVQSITTAPNRREDTDRAPLRNRRTYDNAPLKDLHSNRTLDVNMDDAWDKFLGSSSDAIESSLHSPSVQQTDTERAGPSSRSAAQSVQPFTRSPAYNGGQRSLHSSFVAQISGLSENQPSTGGTVAATRGSSSPTHTSDGLATNLGVLSSACLASPSTANHESSLSSGEGSSYKLTPYKKPEKKIVFTRPRPFVGRNANFEAAVEESLHFGRGIVANERGFQENGKRDRYIRSIVDADGIELIEDG